MTDTQGNFFFVVLGLELRACTLKPLHFNSFMKGFFKIASCKLFAWIFFKLQSS
jgi:hypothetical protein